jgi:hypothetical protein
MKYNNNKDLLVSETWPQPTQGFLCHAGEDKEQVVRPLARKLEDTGITCWLDEAEVRWGENSQKSQ